MADELGDGRVFAMGLFEAAPDAILIVRQGGIIALANRMAERIFGYDRAEMIGQSVEMLVPDSHRHNHADSRGRFERAPRVREMGGVAALEGRRKNGETVPVEISLSPVESPAGRLTIAIIRDVTHRRQLEERLRFASTHDALTDLFNRAYLDSIRGEMEASSAPVGVLMVDVDGLKQVNDKLGHEAGDQILRRCSVVLRSASLGSSVVARLGGDEFAILIPHSTQASVDQAVLRVREDLARHNEITRGPKLQISIGSAVSEPWGGVTQAMRLADLRMYDDKKNRRAQRQS
jgi:diguanylate cyclase (GGDEF)-like protein/PAS domain S-box-containing protein